MKTELSMKAVIIAAGLGSRLWNVTNNIPKTLLPFGKGTILSTIIGNLQQAGITSIYIVVGYNQQHILEYLTANRFEIPIYIIENPLWEKGNALSVYQVKSEIREEPFLLTMSDHIVSIPALRNMVQAEERINLLLVDPFIHNNFDIDDATKVLVNELYISQIGKELPDYNALDCGIFRLEPDFFSAVEKAVAGGKDSISAAITELCQNKRMRVVFMDKSQQWIDIDTPEAYLFATNNYTKKISENYHCLPDETN